MLLALPRPAGAAVPNRETGELHQLAFSEPSIQPTLDLGTIDALGAGLAPEVRDAWSGFAGRQARPEGWYAQVDQRSGLVEIAEGAGVPWVPGYGNRLRLTDIATHLRGRPQPDLAALESIARSFLEGVAPLLGAGGYDLRLDRRASGSYGGYLWQVEFDAYPPGEDLPIDGARVFFRVNNGNLVQFGATRLPAPQTPVPAAVLDREAALEVLDTYLGGLVDGRDRLYDLGSQHLLPVAARPIDGAAGYAVGEGYRIARVWQFVFARDGVAGTWRARIDAASGELLELRDIRSYSQVTGGIWPVSWRVGGVDQAQTVAGLPFVDLSPLGETSNSSGVYYWDGNPQTASHSGPFVVVNDACGASSLGSGAGGDVAWGSLAGFGPGDCTSTVGGPGNTASARMQFYHLNKIKEKARGYLPSNVFAASQFTTNVNVNSSCNAFWDPVAGETTFFTSGFIGPVGGCPPDNNLYCGNTGESAGISLHEFGHGIDTNDGNDSSIDNGTGETYGDITAVLQTHNSCIGNGFITGCGGIGLNTDCGGYGNACNSCDGVRDIDWEQHAANAPMTVASFTQPTCPSDGGGGYVGPCGLGQPQPDDKEGHCESYVSSGAIYDFAAKDLRSGTQVNVGACPPFCDDNGPYNEAGAWQVADRLWYLSRPSADMAFNCDTAPATWTSDGCNANSNWRTMRFVDDDNGDLTDGTPHSCHLAAAFDRHGIACTSDVAWNTCFRGCTPPAAPVLAAPVAGNNRVSLSWTGAGGVVDVFRNEVGCNSGFTKIADDVAGTTYEDPDAANGTTYYYQIVEHPAGMESCGSVPSTCQSATPAAAPSATYVQGSAQITAVPTDNDGDGYIDNCETGRIEYEVYNDGNVALTNVEVAIGSPEASVSVVTAMPTNLGALATDARVTGSFDFDLDGAACLEDLDFQISVTADQMGATSADDGFSLGPVETDTASRTDSFESGNDGWTLSGFARDSTQSTAGSWSVSSTGGNNTCDAATSPTFTVLDTTAVRMSVRYDIEAQSGGAAWDRANVHAVGSGGAHSLLAPTGAAYTQTLPPGAFVCHVTFDDGWVGQGASWPAWEGDAIFDLSALAGQDLQLEVNYNTDTLITGAGFWFDNVRFTDLGVCDVQSDVCTPCVPPAAPTGLTAFASAPNQITLDWNAVAPAPSQYRIYRSTTMGGPYSQVGSVGGGTLTFDDTGLTPDVTYYYVVRAFDVCESADSNEASAVAFGDCATPPTFGGVQTVDPISAGGSCGLRLGWSAGTNNCGSEPVVYNVYGDTTPGFTPGPGNLLQACVTGTTFDDTTVTGGNTYYYVVRAEDDAVGGGGPCQGGNEEANLVEDNGFISSGTVYVYKTAPDNAAEDFENPPWAVGSFADWNTLYVFTGGTSNDWVGVRACSAQSGSQIFRMGRPSNPNSCTANYTNNTDGIAFPDPVGGEAGIRVPAGVTATTLRFWHQWQFGSNGGDFGALYLSSDLTSSYFYIGQAYLSGQTYNFNNDRFANASPGYVSGGGNYLETVVDLAQFCNDNPATFGGSDCAGRDLHVTFRGFANANQTRDGWFLDDVEVTASGTACTAAPGAVQFLTATATSGQNEIEWLNPSVGGYASTMIRWATGGYPSDPADGNLLVDQNDGLGGKGTAVHGGLTNGTTYYYSAFVANGTGEYSARRTVSARPFDTSGNVNWAYSTGASALAPPGIGSVYGVANDRVLHSMDTAGGGTWPAGWTPMVMNGPAQSRPPIVPISLGGASKVAFLGSQDHRVYAVDADSGSTLWSSPDLGAIVQGAPAGIFTAFGGAYDLIFAGTRDGAGGSELFGLDLADGAVAWSFDNSVAQGGDDSDVGIISSDPVPDWATLRVYFASRRRPGGSSNTVWCLDFTGATVSLAWARDLGDVDGSPILAGGRLYVGTNAGEVHALDPATGADLWAAPFAASDGPIKGYVWPRFGTSQLFFSTNNRLWSITDNGTGATLNANWPETAIPNPSIPLVFSVAGNPYAWVGSSDGRLYQLDLSAADPPASRTWVTLGDGSATVGSPALDVTQGIAYVGSEEGRMYAVDLPLP